MWSTFFGAMIPVIGAIFVVNYRISKEKKAKNNVNKIILHYDLIYLKEKITEYVESSDENKNNKYFYRIKYVDINKKWRETITELYNSKILNKENIKYLYDFFTDLRYISDKTKERVELRNNDFENKEKRMKEISDSINKKYHKMNKNIKKLEKIIDELNNKSS